MRLSLRHIFAGFAALILIAGCDNQQYLCLSGYAQGGTYSVKYSSQGVRIRPERLQREVDDILHTIDTTLSGYNRASILSRLNEGDSVVLPALYARTYELSYRMWQQTEGAFDAACGPLFNVWGFGFKGEGQMPSKETVASLKKECGMGRLISPERMWDLVGKKVCADDFLLEGQSGRPALNFNAIAQGLSCDLVAEHLHSLGIHDMLVDIGEIYCEGLSPSHQGWKIAIDNPTDGNNSPGADIRDVWQSSGEGGQGVVTSGNYRKFYIRDGKKFAHTIDPRTGFPVEHDLLSATVVAPTAAQADALATYFMVIGKEQAAAWIEAHEGYEACLITSRDAEWHRKAPAQPACE